MKTKAWGAVVMVAFAWVLWSKAEEIGSRKSGKWTPSEAFNSKKECKKSGEQSIDNIFPKGSKMFTEKRINSWSYLQKTGSDSYMIVTEGSKVPKGVKETTVFLTHYCFASDFDPRPRK